MGITAYHARYFANEIACRHQGLDGLSQTLFDAKVDLNPHQISAALFALKNPLQQGVLLADEVGLGKTIEAGLVLCQLWAEQKRKLLIICPAVLCKQWENELADKFALPAKVVDRLVIKKSGQTAERFFKANVGKQILIMSHQFAVKCEPYLVGERWHRVVIDEAHKFRNAHRTSNKMGQALRRIFNGQQKLLLTATPLQNSLMELYGLSTLLDEYLFGDEKEFRKSYVNSGDLDGLRLRLQNVVKRTLRKQVLEYVHYTERKAITQSFNPSDAEHALYERISAYLQEEITYALPKRNRHLLELILRKLLASSPVAVIDTLQKIKCRLQSMQENSPLAEDDNPFDLLLEDVNSDEQEWDDEEEAAEDEIEQKVLAKEIADIDSFIQQAQQLTQDSKAVALLEALKAGFAEMAKLGAEQKAIIFTESTRTQAHLMQFLSEKGYADKLVAFNGTNNGVEAEQIYEQFKQRYQGTDKLTGSVEVDKRTALIEHFKQHAQIMIATEAASEGVNLQFCSLLINYDLPWNPQRVEQRIGRCHRYGQKFDVVVINFLNQRNAADKRVLELLTQKFHLFDGVFGASDDILGKIESGVDIEKKILSIYQSCRTESEIQEAFDRLQKEYETQIDEKMAQTRAELFSGFDQDVLARLKIDAEHRLNQIQEWVWKLTQFCLADYANFNQSEHCFYLSQAPQPDIQTGRYHLLKNQTGGMLYRLSQPLGQWCLTQGLKANTPQATLHFAYQANEAGRLSLIEQFIGQSGYLRIDKMRTLSEVETKERLIFTACTQDGQWLDGEFVRKLFALPARLEPSQISTPISLADTARLRIDSEIAKLGEENMALLDSETERLNQWAEDLLKAASEEIAELNDQIEQAKRAFRLAQTLEEKQQCQTEQNALEKLRRKKRSELFEVEDEIAAKRDALIDETQWKLKQSTEVEPLFCVAWRIEEA